MFDYMEYFDREGIDRLLRIKSGIYRMNDTEICIYELMIEPGINIDEKIKLIKHYEKILPFEVREKFYDLAKLVESLYKSKNKRLSVTFKFRVKNYLGGEVQIHCITDNMTNAYNAAIGTMQQIFTEFEFIDYEIEKNV